MPRPWTEMGRYGGVGIDLVLAILLLGWGGHWIDQHHGSGGNTWMMVGGLLGVVVGVRNLVLAARRMQRDIERAEARDPLANRWTVDEGWLHKNEDVNGLVDGASLEASSETKPEPPPHRDADSPAETSNARK